MKELNEQGLRRRKSIKNLKLSHSNPTDRIKPLHYNKNNKMHNKLSQQYILYIDKMPFNHHTKSNSRMINIIEICIVCGALFTGYFVYHYSDRMYIPIMKFYAHLGLKEAQNRLSQHLLYHANTKEQFEEAVYWLKISAIQNKNPIASYNYVIAHFKEHITESNLTTNQVNDLLTHALNNGVSEAQHLLNHCSKLENLAKLKNIVLNDESGDEDEEIVDYLM
ncbi:hypothetical protein Smp_036670 [Schistosoma mansoni]|uniref:Sel1 repeat family protein n=1 Tax=Schistosoma mansoni TaxID=6183 RepID=G4VQN2_SCHMA|nr:hypothetical protein Smp_036670 [Schistosoma mansoni]|eukprot:XP_018654090.1 hypothetical protein Smp_036670 [Schistosoma mansoni]